MPETSPQVSVEILETSSERLVTDIEILSLTNKRADGRDHYLARRMSLLLSPAHLVEIDLLRSGQRVPMRGAAPSVPYFVTVSRAKDRPTMDVWPIPLDAPLPTVGIPLLEGDPDVPLDLQRVLTNAYELGASDLRIDYRNDPDVPLSVEHSAIARERLKVRR